MDEAFDARLKLDEGAVVGDVGDSAAQAHRDRVFGLDSLPGIGLQLLHAKRDAVRLVVDLDDLDLHLLTDVEHLGRMIDAPPGDVGHVQQAVDAAQIDERTIVGDVLDDAVDDLTLFEILHQLLTLLGARLLENGAARHHDVPTPAIHFQDLKRLRHVHERSDVADRPDIDLRTRKKCHRAIEVDREAAFHLIENDARDLLIALEGLLELAPAFLPARLVAREYRLAERVLDALQVNLDRIADLELVLAARARELAQRHAAFGLQADIDDREVFLNADNDSLDDRAFLEIALMEGLLEHTGKIFARRRGGSGSNHELSWCTGGWNEGRP